MKRKIGLLLTIVSMVLVSFSIIPVKAENMKDLDLVLVLDKSGSMETSDPNKLMLEAADMLVEMMPSHTSRVGIIAFNRDQEVVVDMTTLSDYDSIVNITQKIDAISYKGGTDLGSALYQATTLFEDHDSAKGILLLSDGEDDFSSWEQSAMIAGEEALNEALTWSSNNDCKIYTLGFNYKGSMEVGGDGYVRLNNISDTTNGQFAMASEANEIHEFFVSMLGDLMGTYPESIYDNEINIKSYVKEANIYISSVDSTAIDDDSIRLYDPDGNALDLSSNSDVYFYQSTYSAVIKLFNPQAGIWKVETDFDGDVKVGYIALYEFELQSSLLDANNQSISQVTNGSSATLSVGIYQDDNLITDPDIYNDSSFQAQATITARLSDHSETIDLSYDNNYLTGTLTFEEECVYDIDVSVSTDNFHIEDTLSIETTNAPIELSGNEIGKQSVDKGKSITITNDELDKIVSDKEGDDYDYTVTSSNEDKATVEKEDDGIKINGLKWGSATINVVFKDVQGNSVDTSFVVNVRDLVLMIFFGSIPFIIAAVVILVLYLIARQSRFISGSFQVHKVTITKGKEITTIGFDKAYKANVFLKRRKNLSTGMKKYASDIYNMEYVTEDTELLYSLMTSKESLIRQYLEDVQFVGTYLGRRGCVLKIKKNSHVSLNNDKAYGRAVKRAYRDNGEFTVYVDDGTYKVSIDGSYVRVNRRNVSQDDFSDFGSSTSSSYSQRDTNSNSSDFDDDFFD